MRTTVLVLYVLYGVVLMGGMCMAGYCFYKAVQSWKHSRHGLRDAPFTGRKTR